MKALTVKQPWAWALFHGKTVENRTRPTSHLGQLAIHAGLTWDRNGGADMRVWDLLAPCMTPRQLERGYIDRAEHNDRFRFGAVIGVVQMVGCHRAVDGCCSPWGDDGIVWHWVVTDPVLLAEPVPCRGRLGLFDVPGISRPADRRAS